MPLAFSAPVKLTWNLGLWEIRALCQTYTIYDFCRGLGLSRWGVGLRHLGFGVSSPTSQTVTYFLGGGTANPYMWKP